MLNVWVIESQTTVGKEKAKKIMIFFPVSMIVPFRMKTEINSQ